MSAVVLSCGRTGTTVALEILRGSDYLSASKEIEDKQLFQRNIEYPDNYLTKMDTTYIDKSDLTRLLKQNPNMKIIWTIRDPRDVVMSKIHRGQLNTEGRGNWISSDGTPEGARTSLRKMMGIYKHGINKFPTKIKLIRMEDMLHDTKATAQSICDFLNIDFEEAMCDFPRRMRVPHKRKRYGDKIDPSQISLWKNLNHAYDGFFKKYKAQDLFGGIDDIIDFFGYPDGIQ